MLKIFQKMIDKRAEILIAEREAKKREDAERLIRCEKEFDRIMILLHEDELLKNAKSFLQKPKRKVSKGR